MSESNTVERQLDQLADSQTEQILAAVTDVVPKWSAALWAFSKITNGKAMSTETAEMIVRDIVMDTAMTLGQGIIDSQAVMQAAEEALTADQPVAEGQPSEEASAA